MMRPNFLGVGVQRAGTTWIHNCLSEHPEAYLPEAKELQFFIGDNYEKGWAWYEAQFEEGGGLPAVGEISPNYFNRPEALVRIAEALPDVKLFAVLREPVSRARSAYGLVRERLYPGLTFEQACEHEDGYLLRLGLYAEPIKFLYDHFPRENVKILVYDDVEAAPGEVLRELHTFLGIRATFVPTLMKARINQAMYPKTQAYIERLGLSGPLEGFKSSRLGQTVKRAVARRTTTSRAQEATMAPEFVARMNDYFRPSIDEVEALIGRDLSAWKGS